ncbi:MAG: putative Ig domain-containing protein [Chitinophagaceae bacterium]
MGRLICDKRCSSFFIYLLLQLSFFSLHAQKLSFTTQPNNRVAARNKFSYTFSAMDSANRIIEYSCTVLPSWISFDKATNTLSGITKKNRSILNTDQRNN